jgi:hypothetical protein
LIPKAVFAEVALLCSRSRATARAKACDNRRSADFRIRREQRKGPRGVRSHGRSRQVGLARGRSNQRVRGRRRSREPGRPAR